MRRVFHADGVTLYHGDCREFDRSLCFDAIVTDPPFNETNLEWDVWPSGWPAQMLRHAPQMWCFGSMRMFWDRRDEFIGWRLAQDVVWEKHNGSGLHNDRFRRVHELALHFYQGKWGALYKNPPVVEVVEDRPRRAIKRSNKPAHWGETTSGAAYEYDGARLQRSVIPVRSCHGYAVNETQMPEGIVAPLLKCCVPRRGTVLDPFAGSGTVLAVARSLGMRAVGIEKRESQCKEIIKRLSQRELVMEGAR